MDASQSKTGLFSSVGLRRRCAELEKAVRILELSERDLKTRLDALTKVASKLRAERDAKVDSEEWKRVFDAWISALFALHHAYVTDPPAVDHAEFPNHLFNEDMLHGDLFRNKVVELSGLFDAGYYVDRNRDLRLQEESPLDHYLRIGGLEGRPAGPRFDSDSYLKANLDVEAGKVNPLIHYLLYGFKEGRRFTAPPASYIREDVETRYDGADDAKAGAKIIEGDGFRPV